MKVFSSRWNVNQGGEIYIYISLGYKESKGDKYLLTFCLGFEFLSNVVPSSNNIEPG